MSRGPVGTTTRAVHAAAGVGAAYLADGARAGLWGVPTRWSRTVRAPKRRERSTVGQPYVCVLLMSGITDLRVDLDTVRRPKTRSRSAQPCRDNLCKCRTDQESYLSRPFSTSVPESPGAQRAFVGGAGRRGPPTCGGRAIWVRASRTASRMSIPSGMKANASG
jgi:hypothetical protein